jgi:hypothetical protein
MERYQIQVEFTRWNVVFYNMEDIMTSQRKGSRTHAWESIPKVLI